MPGEPPEDGEMNEMTLPSRHRIRNSSPGGLRPSTLPLDRSKYIYFKQLVSYVLYGFSVCVTDSGIHSLFFHLQGNAPKRRSEEPEEPLEGCEGGEEEGSIDEELAAAMHIPGLSGMGMASSCEASTEGSATPTSPTSK